MRECLATSVSSTHNLTWNDVWSLEHTELSVLRDSQMVLCACASDVAALQMQQVIPVACAACASCWHSALVMKLSIVNTGGSRLCMLSPGWSMLTGR